MQALVRPYICVTGLAGMLIAGLGVSPGIAQDCSESTIEGTYAFALQGNVRGVGPIAASGTTTFDGEGAANITGFINRRSRGRLIEASLDGTYTVNPEDCTGSAEFSIPAPGLFNRFLDLRFEGVIVNQGAEIRYLITTPGIAFAGSSVRQEPRP